MINWHCKSEGRPDMTNFSIGYVDGRIIYHILYKRHGNKCYDLYMNGEHVSEFKYCFQAITAAAYLQRELETIKK